MWASAGGEGLSTWASRLGSVLLHRMTARSVMVMDVAAAGTAPQSERRVERESRPRRPVAGSSVNQSSHGPKCGRTRTCVPEILEIFQVALANYLAAGQGWTRTPVCYPTSIPINKII